MLANTLRRQAREAREKAAREKINREEEANNDAWNMVIATLADTTQKGETGTDIELRSDGDINITRICDRLKEEGFYVRVLRYATHRPDDIDALHEHTEPYRVAKIRIDWTTELVSREVKKDETDDDATVGPHFEPRTRVHDR